MQKTLLMKKILGAITLSFSLILIGAAILALAGGGGWWYIDSLKEDKKKLTEHVGELKSKVETLEKANLDLVRQIDFQTQLNRSNMVVSQQHAQIEAELRSKATEFKEGLSKQTVVVTQTAPISREHQRNSQARIGVLWASYCDATKDVKRCTDKHIKPQTKDPQGKALSSLDWIFVPYADRLSGWIESVGEPIGLNDIREVKETNHA